MIITGGFKVNNQRAVQFRKWTGQIVKDYIGKDHKEDYYDYADNVLNMQITIANCMKQEWNINIPARKLMILPGLLFPV